MCILGGVGLFQFGSRPHFAKNACSFIFLENVYSYLEQLQEPF
jgi:hypothetical protein